MKLRILLLGVLLPLFAPVASQAAVMSFVAWMDGPSEDPPNLSPGTGAARLDYDDTAHTLRVSGWFANLTANTTAAHIHAPTAMPFMGTAGVATQVPSFVGFPLGVTSGMFDFTLDLTNTGSFNPAYVTANGGTAAGAEMALISAIAGGTAYFNVHSAQYARGEIRGFFHVPDGSASTALLLGIGLAALLARRRLIA